MPLRAPCRRHGRRLPTLADRARARLLAPVLALAAASSSPVAAADTLSWPSPWTPGQTWRYRTELVEVDTTEGRVDEQRITGTSTLRIAQDPARQEPSPRDPSRRDGGRRDGDGLLQVWTSSGSRVEAVRGERGIADAMAGVLDDLDRIPVELRLDRAGRADGVRNLTEIRPKVRTAMDRVLDQMVDAMIAAESPDLDDQEHDLVRAMVRPMVAAQMDALIDETSVSAMLGADLEDFNAFTGAAYAVGAESRAADPLYMPISGQPLAATRAYRAQRDPAQPGQAYIEWTTALDADAAADAALWTLAAEIAGEPALDGSSGRPIGLEFAETGRIDWRPADGAILRMQIERRQRYGRDHQSTTRLVYTLADGPGASDASASPAASTRIDASAASAGDASP